MTLHGRARLARGTLLLSVAALAGCGKAASSAAANDPASLAPPPRLGMVGAATGAAGATYDARAYAGLRRAKARLGADVQIVESRAADDYRSNLTLLADEDYDDVFAVGSGMTHDLTSVARLYPKRHFAIVGGYVDEPNVTSLQFRDQEGSFLAGALAALVSKTRTIGFLGGIDTAALEKFEAGFRAGAREIDPHVRVRVAYTGSFDDAAAAGSAAAAAYGAGADVLYVVAGTASAAAIAATRERRDAYAIGVDLADDALAPGKLLTSVIRRADVAVFATAQDARSQKLPAGNVAFGLENGGIVLARFGRSQHLIGARNVERLVALRREIVDGTLVPPSTRAALARFRAANVTSGERVAGR